MYNNFKLYKETYNFILYIYPEINKFPRVYKYTLGQDILKTTISFFRKITLYAKHKQNCLLDADIDLEILRIYVRLTYDIKTISFKKYEIISKKLNDLGGLLGGIIKQNK